ncbi:hypothetical protein [Kribbella sp. NPDC049227]|uniref:hypothetical protein n=1 Tax=Kribbella sp. NPDC049227 TaxID=3364113 RepID=UPI00371B7A27
MLLRTSWPMVLLAVMSAGSVALLSVAGPSNAVPLFVVHLAAVALASGTAYLLDEAAIAVTSSTPQGLWRRRAPTLFAGLAVAAAAWTVVVVLLNRQSPTPSTSALTIEVVALVSTALAAAAVTARRGEPEPGNLVAPAIVLLGVGALIAQPALDITLFMGGPGDPDRRVWWVGIAIAATIVMLIASRDAATRPRRPLPHPRGL